MVFFLYRFLGYLSGIALIFLAGDKVEKEKSTISQGKRYFFPLYEMWETSGRQAYHHATA